MRNAKSITVEIINECRDYDRFTSLSGSFNRPKDETHIRRLMASFTEFGTNTLRLEVVLSSAFTGVDVEYLADGQHSIIACKRLGLPFSVIIIRLVEDTPLNVTKYISTLNNSSKSWSTNNFLASFAANGIPEYKRMQEEKNRYGLTVTDLLNIFMGNGGAKENKQFKSGEMRFVDETRSTELLHAVVRIMPYIPNKAYIRRSLYKIMRMTSDYKRLAEAIVNAGEHLRAGASAFPENEADFYDHMVKVYKLEFGNSSAQRKA